MTTETWLCPDRLFDGETLATGRALGLKDGRTTTIRPVADLPSDAPCRPLSGTLTPGFTDLQVNGGGDILFNTSPTPGGLRMIAAAHRRFGTTAILPTLITDTPETLARAVEAILAAQPDPALPGLHIEGPHIAPSRRGTHSAAHIRPLDETTIAHVARLRAAGLAVMITLAPEAVVPGQVARLAALGAIVSIGHSDATADQTRALLAEGATAFTHLFNAMSPMLARAPGVTGAAINSTAHAGLIADGIHVAPEMLALAIRARPVPDRMFLVSDAMPTVGGSGRFRLYSDEIRLEAGRLVNAEGTLAGAHTTMAEGLARLIATVRIPPETALKMATTTPARVISRPDLARLTGRDPADLLLLGADWRLLRPLADPPPA